jgi:hypothetical protein
MNKNVKITLNALAIKIKILLEFCFSSKFENAFPANAQAKSIKTTFKNATKPL